MNFRPARRSSHSRWWRRIVRVARSSAVVPVARRVLVMFFIFWLPAQAAAMSFFSYVCKAEPVGKPSRTESRLGADDHRGDAGDAPQSGGAYDESAPRPVTGDLSSGGGMTGYDCCDDPLCGAVAAVANRGASPAAAEPTPPPPHPRSFIPEQPKQPPLAHS